MKRSLLLLLFLSVASILVSARPVSRPRWRRSGARGAARQVDDRRPQVHGDSGVAGARVQPRLLTSCASPAAPTRRCRFSISSSARIAACCGIPARATAIWRPHCSTWCTTGWSAIIATASRSSSPTRTRMATTPGATRRSRRCNDPAMPIEFVAPTVEAASEFFAIDPWPTGMGQVDLGGRVLNIVPIPGHDKYAIALYDRKTGIVLTGDNLYPGRLYIPDFPTYKASTERLIAFLEGKPVAHVLGNHIEETSTPFLGLPDRLHLPPQRALPRAYLRHSARTSRTD